MWNVKIYYNGIIDWRRVDSKKEARKLVQSYFPFYDSLRYSILKSR